MNMENQNKCIIWGTSLLSEREVSNNLYELDSPRVGGKYVIDRQTYIGTLGGLDDQEKIRLSGWIVKENLRGIVPLIYGKGWSLEKLPPIPNIRERAYLLLEGLVKETKTIGKQFYTSDLFNSLPEYIVGSINEKYAKTRMYPYLFLYALSYCEKEDEMRFLLNYLIELNFIGNYGDSDFFQVAVQGFEKIHELSKSINSKTAFIAMWFHDSMKELEKNIDTSVKKAGYIPFIIKNKEHLNKIDDEILNEINKARLVICDLTSEKEKPRGSVYFEAGYAMGKDIPVVWTCRKELEKEIPFDIRQYNCLFWEKGKMDDFIKKLQYRIENTVGKCPLKGV